MDLETPSRLFVTLTLTGFHCIIAPSSKAFQMAHHAAALSNRSGSIIVVLAFITKGGNIFNRPVHARHVASVYTNNILQGGQSMKRLFVVLFVVTLAGALSCAPARVQRRRGCRDQRPCPAAPCDMRPLRYRWRAIKIDLRAMIGHGPEAWVQERGQLLVEQTNAAGGINKGLNYSPRTTGATRGNPRWSRTAWSPRKSSL
jgi:hypothetical protein